MAKIRLFVFFLNFIHLCNTAKTNQTKGSAVQSITDAFEYLSQFGYNPCKSQADSGAAIGSVVLCQSSAESMLKKFQARYRLPTTGKLDRETLRVLNTPRCGMGDNPYAPLAFKTAIGWPKKSFTWKLQVNKYLPSMGVKKVRDQIRESFNDWAKYAPLTFQEVSHDETADFDIAFVDKDHQDGEDFARYSTILAYAHLPIRGMIRFSSEHNWVEKYDRSGFNIRLVATHEIGHALGLYHSSDRSAIMFEQYQLISPKSLLPKDDRDGIQKLYGIKEQPTKATSATTRKTVKTTKKRMTESNQDRITFASSTITAFSTSTSTETTAKAKTTDLYDHMIVILRNKGTEKVLNSNADKDVSTLDLNGSNYQKWMLIRQNDGTYVLRNIATSLILASNSEKLYTTYFNNDAHEKWRFHRQHDGTYLVQNQATSRALHSTGISEAQSLHSSVPDHQKWIIASTRVGPYNGMIAVLRNKATQKVLDSSADKNVYALDHNGNTNQKWILSRQDNGTYTLRNLQTSFLLDSSNERIYTSYLSGGARQKWRFYRQNDGSYVVRNAITLHTLESTSSINGGDALDSNIRNSQKWFFEGK